MFKKSMLWLSLFFFSYTFAQENALSEVRLNLSQEQWVTTQTAKVIVEMNANLDQSGLDTVRKQLLSKLQKIVASDDWHITRFDRSQNQSGLEQLIAQAEARVPSEKLTDVRNQAKAVSKAGETFTVIQIEFSPSLSDYEAARARLRQEIYNKVNSELAALNKAYPEQHYHVQSIDFSAEQSSNPAPLAARMNMMKVAGASGSNNLAVSNQLKLDALVILAADNNKAVTAKNN